MSESKSTVKRRQRLTGKDNESIYFRIDAAGKQVLEVYFKDENGKQHFQRVEGGVMAARAYRDSKRGNKAQGISVAPVPKIRFSEAAREWIETEVVAGNLKQATQDSYRYALRHCTGFGFLDTVKTKDVANLIQRMRTADRGKAKDGKRIIGYSESQLKRVREVISAVYKFAAREMGYRGINPAENLSNKVKPKPSKRKKSRRIYTMAELSQTLAATSERFRILFMVAAITGARPSEILALRWQDIDLSDEATIRIEYQIDRYGNRQDLKTDGSKRTIPIPTSLANALTAYKLSRPYLDAQAFVFATATGRPISKRNALRALRAAQERARTPEGHPTFPDPALAPNLHAFRHMAASIAINAGDPLAEISWRLGHADTHTTASVYSHEIADYDQRQQKQRERDEQRYGSMFMETDVNGSRNPAPATDSLPDPEMDSMQAFSSDGQ